MMRKFILPALAASLALAATAPIIADRASATDWQPSDRRHRSEVDRLRDEVRLLKSVNQELMNGLDRIEDSTRYLRDRRGARTIMQLVQETRDRAGVVHTMPVPNEPPPPPARPGVVIFEHSNFRGEKQFLEPGSYDLQSLRIGNDKLSSLQVPPGWRVWLYTDAGFRGQVTFIGNDTPFVGDALNDKVSSIIVEPPGPRR